MTIPLPHSIFSAAALSSVLSLTLAAQATKSAADPAIPRLADGKNGIEGLEGRSRFPRP